MKFRILSIAMCWGLQACVVTTTGHKVPLNKLNELVVGETTMDQIKKKLGAPEVETDNPADSSKVLNYSWVVARVIGFGLPPFFTIGRSSSSGYQLNVVLLENVFQGYTLINLNGTIFPRKDVK